MAGTDRHHARAIGEKLRASRQAHRLSLRALAARAEISASMLSQIETGKAFPSVRSLYNIAAALGVTVDHFFPDQGALPVEDGAAPVSAGDLTASQMRSALLSHGLDSVVGFAGPAASSAVVPSAGRPTIELNGGVTWARLTGLAETDAEFLEIHYAPGAASGLNMSHHGGREFGLILEGELTVELGFDSVLLQAGDTIIFESSMPHRLSNRGLDPMRAVWVVIKTG